ncbi:hypothetical protein KBZ21_41220, partial [Streptomyces sp. A73]|nr:hypothetical protein [Streptomyces sp. A73]
ERADGTYETPFALVVDPAGPTLVDETGLLGEGLQQNLREQLGGRVETMRGSTLGVWWWSRG